MKVWSRFERYVFPVVGWKQINEVSGLEILDDIIRKIENKGRTETSHKLLQNCAAVFRLAYITGRVQFNPLTDLRGVLKPHRSKSFPTIHIDELPEFLQKLDDVQTTEIMKLAVRMLDFDICEAGRAKASGMEAYRL